MKLTKLGKGGRIALAIGAAGAASGIGLLAVPATFGGYTSSASNNGNSAAAGTLQMTDNANGAVVTVSNLDPNCNNVLHASTAPCEQHGTVTIKNTGSLPATMQLTVGSVGHLPEHANLTSAVTPGDTTIHVTALPAPVTNGDTLTVGADSFTASAAAATGALSITVNPAPSSETNGARVTDPAWPGTGNLSTEAVLSIDDGTNTIVGSPSKNDGTNSNANTTTINGAATAGGGIYTLPPTSGAQWAPGESHTYTVSVQLPNGADDTYQGTSATFGLTWAGAS